MAGPMNAFGTGRTSPQRRAIAEAVCGMGGAFTVDDLVRAVQGVLPGVGVATVYRAVGAMEDSGFVEAVGSRGGTTLYAHCRHTDHHHHMVCTRCGNVADCPCPVDDNVRSAADASGFTLTGHEVTLYGLCRTCRCAEES